MADRSTRTTTNPEHDELTELLTRARASAERVARALDGPVALMSRDRVWTGPTAAEVFAQELDGRRAELPRRWEAFIDAIEERRARVPPTVDAPAGEQ